MIPAIYVYMLIDIYIYYRIIVGCACVSVRDTCMHVRTYAPTDVGK